MSVFTPVAEPSYRKRLGYQAMLLAGICSLVAILILIGEDVTRHPIADAKRQDQLDMLSQVLPKNLYNNDPLADVVTLQDTAGETEVFIARQNGSPVAFAYGAVGYGYSGAINLMMGVKASGDIIGVRVTAHAETPGLGDKIEINKDDWITSFDGKSLTNTSKTQWAVEKDGGEFDQFTGATITPRAVVGAVHEGLEFFNRHRTELLQSQHKDSNPTTESNPVSSDKPTAKGDSHHE